MVKYATALFRAFKDNNTIIIKLNYKLLTLLNREKEHFSYIKKQNVFITRNYCGEILVSHDIMSGIP